VLPGRFAPYGYRYDGESATYVVNEETAPHLRRIFRMVGAEGKSMSHVKRVFEREGVAPPGGGRFWHVSTVRRIIDDEIYVPRKGRELKGVVPPEVSAALIPERDYGIYWFNRSRVKRVYTGERVVAVTPNDPAEHVAIPVESAGVPAPWVLSAREKVSANVKVSFAGGQKRELSGGMLRCPCGSAMTVFTVRRKSGKRVFHYVCGAFRRHGKEACDQWKYHAAGRLEERVRDFVYRLISDPESPREELRETHAAEHQDAANAGEEERALLEIISETDAERDRIVRLYARGGAHGRRIRPLRCRDRRQEERHGGAPAVGAFTSR
jgi:hypothetical protein